MTKANPFAGQTPGWTSPPTSWARVPESNMAELTFVGRCVILPAECGFTITQMDGTTFAFASGELAAGVVHPMIYQNISENTGEVIAGY